MYKGPTLDGDIRWGVVLKYATLAATIFFVVIPAGIWALISYTRFLAWIGGL